MLLTAPGQLLGFLLTLVPRGRTGSHQCVGLGLWRHLTDDSRSHLCLWPVLLACVSQDLVFCKEKETVPL